MDYTADVLIHIQLFMSFRFSKGNAKTKEPNEGYYLYDVKYLWFMESESILDPIKNSHPLSTPCTLLLKY